MNVAQVVPAPDATPLAAVHAAGARSWQVPSAMQHACGALQSNVAHAVPTP